MNNNRPRGREKNVTGPGKTVNKRGEGLHTGPVGDSGGYSDRREPSGGSGQRGTRSGGGMKLLILLAVLLLGGGGGLGTLLSGGGQSGGQTQPPSQIQQPGQSAGGDLSALLGGLNGGSV